MFNWFRRWRHNRRRAIFQFWDGRTLRRVDPQVVWRALKNHPEFNIDRDLEFHDAGHDDATQLCIAATRAAFGVLEFDGRSGLTEDETIELLGNFGAWTAAVKKNISPPPISSPTSTPWPPKPADSWTAATSNSADSSSIPTACDSVAPAL